MKNQDDTGGAALRGDEKSPSGDDRRAAETAEERTDGGRMPDEAERADVAKPSEDAAGEAPGKSRRSIFKRPLFWIVVVAVIVAIIAAFAYYWFLVRPFETTDDAYIGADIVELAPQISGRIVKDSVVNNTHVKAGDLLVKIDSSSAQASLANAQAQLEQAKANLEQAKVGVEQAQSQQAEAEAQSESARVTANNDEDTLRRDEQLFKSSAGAISQKQVDNDRATARSAEAQAVAAKRAVATAKTAVDAAKAKVTSAEASVRAAESQVNTARITLGYTTITAPISGQVVQKNFNIGTYASTGSPLMAIVPDRLYIDANYKETQLSDIRIGQKVDIKVDAFPDVDFTGKVVSIQHGAGQAFQVLPPQNATGNFVKVVQRVPVRIAIESPDPGKYPLGPGMSVVTKIRVQ
ncbi:MAG: HlyD family secretion protein [Pararhizobium sp.]